MQTRECHADSDADTNANANANRIRTKNNMSPSPSVGDIMNYQNGVKNISQMAKKNCQIHMALLWESPEIIKSLDGLYTQWFWLTL